MSTILTTINMCFDFSNNIIAQRKFRHIIDEINIDKLADKK